MAWCLIKSTGTTLLFFFFTNRSLRHVFPGYGLNKDTTTV
jgi:hypothetical protein